jgi:hypothetical protein
VRSRAVDGSERSPGPEQATSLVLDVPEYFCLELLRVDGRAGRRSLDRPPPLIDALGGAGVPFTPVTPRNRRARGSLLNNETQIRGCPDSNRRWDTIAAINVIGQALKSALRIFNSVVYSPLWRIGRAHLLDTVGGRFWAADAFTRRGATSEKS